jgi:hypothetical protein
MGEQKPVVMETPITIPFPVGEGPIDFFPLLFLDGTRV